MFKSSIPSFKKMLKNLWLALAIVIVLAALLSSLFRALTPLASEYKSSVEEHLSTIIGKPVHIRAMETGWYWFIPVLKLQAVSIADQSQTPIKLDTVMLGLNIWSSIWHWQIQPGVLYINQAHFKLHEMDGYWHIEGFGKSASTNAISKEWMQHFIALLLQQDKLVIKNLSLDLYSKKRDHLSLKDINLTTSRYGDHYRLRGNINLDNASKTTFRLMADMYLDPFALEKTKGNIYIDADNFHYTQWKPFLPNISEDLHKLDGHIKLWIDMKKGKVKSAHSFLVVEQFAYKKQTIDYFTANIQWDPLPSGWRVKADGLKLLTEGRVWPENKLLIEYDRDQDSWLAYIQQLEIGNISAIYPEWNQWMQSKGITGLTGSLTDLQIRHVKGSLNYFLSRFDRIGWSEIKHFPRMKHISGVLMYEPEGGILELDSENTLVQPERLPQQLLSILNAKILWKRNASDTYNVQIERLEAGKMDLAVSATGLIQNAHSDDLGDIQLNVDFSGRKLEQWIPWIPKEGVRPELYSWLRNDLKHISLASGKILVHGKAKDFPFDATPGVFTIDGWLGGADLRIVGGAPLMKNVDIKLAVDKRLLQADFLNAHIDNVPFQNMQLKIHDMGKDEILDIDANIHSEIRDMFQVFKNTAWGKNKPILNKITAAGLAELTMQFRILLYNHEPMTMQGNLILDNIAIQLPEKLAVENMRGFLQFNEHGFQHTRLQGSFLDSPIDIAITPSLNATSKTDIAISGNLHVQALQKHFSHSVINRVVNGEKTPVNLHLYLDNKGGIDTLQVNSNLEGLSIDLPAPFTKAQNRASSFSLVTEFDKNGFKVKTNYGNMIRADLNYQDEKSKYQLKTGVIRIGNTHAAKERLSGLQIVGTLGFFDYSKWKEFFEKVSGNDSNLDNMGMIGYVNVTIKKFFAFNQVTEDLSLQILPGKSSEWAIHVNQKELNAHLTYNPKTDCLAGYFTRLHLEKIKDDTSKNLSVLPQNIPNLNLRIDDLRYGKLNLGNVTFTTKKMPTGMELSYCKMQAPGYVLNAKGNWQVKGNKHFSGIQMNVELSRLAHTLENWSITPAVDAKKGQAYFQANWPGAPYDFSMAATTGQLSLLLRNGRITDLSKEMEQKLGLGKLLSILSLQTIPRRLTLDFSDLSEKGYSFDVFKGNFVLKQGVMNTQDSYIDGPVAYASMKGDLDLVKKSYDLELKISPHIAASLPVVATIAGGPIAGVAAWIAGNIINKGMQSISAYTYRITGPWGNPVVQQLKIIRKPH